MINCLLQDKLIVCFHMMSTCKHSRVEMPSSSVPCQGSHARYQPLIDGAMWIEKQLAPAFACLAIVYTRCILLFYM